MALPGLEFRDRGRGGLAVLIPGWATDARIFDRLDLPCDCLLVDGFSPAALPDGLADGIRCRGGRAIVIGFSLGGVLAAAFAAAQPDLVRRLVLVGMRERYPKMVTAAVAAAVRSNHRGFLTRFYRDLLAGCEPETARWFNRELRTDYLDRAEPEQLVAGLAVLERGITALPAGVPTVFVHGEEDEIAPPAETAEFARRVPGAAFIPVPDAGHLVLPKWGTNTVYNFGAGDGR